jgi:MFS family permease
VAASVLCVSAFSTAPSSLYGLYAERDHLSSFMITIVYAVYAVGIVVSLLLVGHISDWYGRRVVFLPALVLAAMAAGIFVFWNSLPGLLLGRVLTGVLAHFASQALTLPYVFFFCAIVSSTRA